jgi:hypothetical protein
MFNYTMRNGFSSTEDKVISFLSLEVDFLQCIYQPQQFNHYGGSTSAVDFSFVLILLAVLDIILIIFGKRTYLIVTTIYLLNLCSSYQSLKIGIVYIHTILKLTKGLPKRSIFMAWLLGIVI